MKGILKQSPSRLFVYELAKTQDWLSIEPEAGALQPGQSQEITIGFDARNAVVGETYSSPVKLFTVPQLDCSDLTISYTATEASATPRPTNLKASIEGNSSVSLTWSANTDKTPSGYNIYRNEEKINKTMREVAPPIVFKAVTEGVTS